MPKQTLNPFHYQYITLGVLVFDWTSLPTCPLQSVGWWEERLTRISAEITDVEQVVEVGGFAERGSSTYVKSPYNT